jgi:hypothetical protein
MTDRIENTLDAFIEHGLKSAHQRYLEQAFTNDDIVVINDDKGGIQHIKARELYKEEYAAFLAKNG